MNMPLVSVLLISYNEKNLISQALDSIINQKTSFDIEIICHDDASTDGTQEVILEYQKKYPNLIVPILQEENRAQKGHQIIVEYCYPKARGKYIAYCDADDYWTDCNKLQKQVDFLENNPDYSLCFHNFNFLYEKNGSIVTASCGEVDRDFSVDEFILWNANKIPQLGASLFPKSLAMNRPELFVKIGGKNSKRPISDQPLYIYLALCGKVKYFHEIMSVWRRRVTTTWMSEGNINQKIQFMKDKIAFLENLQKQYPDINTEAIKVAKGNCLFNIAWDSKDYRSAWKNIEFSHASSKLKIFIFIGRFLPFFANKVRAMLLD